jgi:hypothetical protein
VSKGYFSFALNELSAYNQRPNPFNNLGIGAALTYPTPTLMESFKLFDGPDCYHWRKTFAFWPVKTIGGKYVWLKKVYKQRFWAIWGPSGFHMEPEVEYAELFDVLKQKY